MHKTRLSVICLCILHTVIGVPEADFLDLDMVTRSTLGQTTQTDCLSFVPGGFTVHGTPYDRVCVSS